MVEPVHPSWQFSKRAQALTSSVIREILKVTERPEVISFAGGLPSPEGFPVEIIRDAYAQVLATRGKSALQYGPTEGYAPLREWVARELSGEGAAVSADQVLIVSGSQQALDLLGKVLIDPGSKVLVETPSYLGALQSFSLYQPEFRAVPSDEFGLIPEALDAELCAGARFLYALPNFQNPTGRTLPVARREALIAAAARHGFPIVEDDPYGELRYRGERLPGLLALARSSGATVIRLGSFSKVLAPGIRLGYLVGPQALVAKLAQAKQATDLHTATLTQMAIYEIVKTGFLETHLPGIRSLYQHQCAVMLEALEAHFPKSVRWTRPDGGMFIWVTLPAHIDSTSLLAESIEQNVAFVPGAPFYAEGPELNTLRLSFVTVPEARIREGIERLAGIIRHRIDAGQQRAA